MAQVLEDVLRKHDLSAPALARPYTRRHASDVDFCCHDAIRLAAHGCLRYGTDAVLMLPFLLLVVPPVRALVTKGAVPTGYSRQGMIGGMLTARQRSHLKHMHAEQKRMQSEQKGTQQATDML